ncbi:MAG: hypothetical protein K9N47_08365 [Prosthecobacter sp.]|uniref:hypothetical protein n=1 Tax=Prosthecobacter sp. TaxID=1965333 RepID=UPI0025ED12A6|nr:hypothetical protein [Prosthecobacter sp.]MCF7786122.1 hypothetical protein [Prosthecobacter sp.]
MHRILTCLLLFTAFLHAEEVDAKNNSIVLGKRVGLIKPGMTATDIERVYGRQNLKLQKIPGAEGEEIDGAKLFAGTDRELEIVWDPDTDKKQVVFDIRVLGKAWKFDNGLKSGMTVEEIEKINGKPFKIAGFDWDYGGYANFEGGKLDGKVSIRFSPSTENVPEYLIGDKQLSSTDKKLRAAKPLVDKGISVFMR